jgi:hypothetical protein
MNEIIEQLKELAALDTSEESGHDVVDEIADAELDGQIELARKLLELL